MDPHALDIRVGEKRIGTLGWHKGIYSATATFSTEDGLPLELPVSLLEEIVGKKKEIHDEIVRKNYALAEENKNSWQKLQERARSFTPEGKDPYEESVGMVIKMIGFSETLVEDFLYNPQIVAMRDAVRSCRYKEAIDKAQNFYEQNYLSKDSEAPATLLEKLLQPQED
jgi:hypothetical protein